MNYIVLAVLLNSFLIKMNFRVLMLYKYKFGLMHTGTVSSMITATKPVINVFVIVLSAVKFRSHQRLLKVRTWASGPPGQVWALDLGFRPVAFMFMGFGLSGFRPPNF